MQFHSFRFQPTLDPHLTEEHLCLLLKPGILGDQAFNHRLRRMEDAFNRYAVRISHGLWAPGLVITNEMRAQAETLLPLVGILPLFDRFFALAASCPLYLGASAIHNALSWPDALRGLEGLATGANPAELLRTLADDESKRRLFFFRNFLPERYGGSFNRYPLQRDFLGNWLRKEGKRFAKGIRCLDAACGSGEGTYDLAALLMECGFPPEKINVCGSTIEPFELFAAAHAYFPHDRQRQEVYQQKVRPLFSAGACQRIFFHLEDLMEVPTNAATYDIVLCNGLLGGPFLHDRDALQLAVANLAGRLEVGGILLAADRFHGGWKRRVPETLLAELFGKIGLTVKSCGEGLVGFRSG